MNKLALDYFKQNIQNNALDLLIYYDNYDKSLKEENVGGYTNYWLEEDFQKYKQICELLTPK